MERLPDSDELDDGDDGPTTAAVIAALRRLLECDELRSSGRSRDFLAYVVTETLAGRGERLKERTVARYALGRGEDFDATSNATARVQASRLRASMARYYSGSGAEDTVVIDIPRGTYVPTFSTRDLPGGGRSHKALRPGIAVVRFADLREGQHRDPAPVALSESVARALSSFPELRVIGPVTIEESGAGLLDAGAVARSFDVEYVLAGAVRATTDVLRLTIRVCDGATGAVLWSEQYDQQRGGVGGFEDEDDLVLRVAATVGDVRGVVRRDVEKHLTVAPGPSGQAAVLAFYRFAESGSRSDTQSAASPVAVHRARRPGSPSAAPCRRGRRARGAVPRGTGAATPRRSAPPPPARRKPCPPWRSPGRFRQTRMPCVSLRTAPTGAGERTPRRGAAMS